MIASLVERWDRRVPPWADAILIGLASRAFAAAVLAIAYLVPLPTPIGRHWGSPFNIWDAEWFLFIVRQGYHAGPVAQTAFGSYYDFAFFPVWPGFIVLASLGGRLAVDVVAPAAANALFVLACVPIGRVLADLAAARGVTAPRGVTRFGLALFAFSPAAYVYSLAYSEPVFLLAVGLFLATRGPVKGFVFGVVAQLTRLSGAALGAASLGDLIDPATRRRGLAGIVVVVLAFGAWWTWIALLTGNPFGYMLGSPAWYKADSATGSLTGLASILNAKHWTVWVTVAFLPTLAVGVGALVRWRQWRLAFYSAACVATAWLVTWNTMPRLAAIAFPAFGAIALLLPGTRTRWLVLLLGAVAEAILGANAIAGHVVP